MRLLVAVLAALVLAPSAPAAVHVVTNFGDAAPGSGPRDPGPPETLRNILMTKANPGDTITFASPSVVMSNGPIRVPQRLRGLIIDGAAGTGRAAIQTTLGGRGPDGAVGLSVIANRVTIQNLVFNDAALNIQSPNVIEHPIGIRILNNLFLGQRGALLGGPSIRTLVQGNVFESAASPVMETNLSRDVQVLGNRFAGSGSFSLQAEGSDRMVIQGNTFQSGTADLLLDGGRVTGNTFQGNGGMLLKTIVDDDAIRRVSVSGNTGQAGIFGFSAGGGLTVENNTFTGSRGVLLGCVPNATRGPEMRFVKNNVIGGGGMSVDCRRKGEVVIASTLVQGATGTSLAVSAGEADVRASSFVGGARGVTVARGAKAEIKGGQITGNNAAGVFVARGARPTTISRVVMGGNAGAGIDKAPAGVSPRAAPGAPTLVYDEKKGKLRGKACPRCLVEIFESEEGAKTGNPNNGEGIKLLGVVRANGLGRFVFPARGQFDCPPSGLVTATATHSVAGTSEFSADEPCSCVISARFGVDAGQVPTTGFANFGISVFFEPGSIVKAAELTDTATDLRPPDNALGPSFNWQEIRNEPFSPGGAYDFFVNVGYNPGAPAPATWPLQVWRYTVPYEPPDSAQGACRAVLDFAFLTPPPE